MKYRRLRGDMIEVYKILHDYYEDQVAPTLSLNTANRTRGNSLKLVCSRFKYDVRKYSFCMRVTSVWNSLPEHVVSSVTLDTFKKNLDNFWVNKDIYYDWRAELNDSYFV